MLKGIIPFVHAFHLSTTWHVIVCTQHISMMGQEECRPLEVNF
jgi:hypothetical protein